MIFSHYFHSKNLFLEAPMLCDSNFKIKNIPNHQVLKKKAVYDSKINSNNYICDRL